MDVRDYLKTAIERAGSEAKLGEATGYSQHAIWRAKRRGSVTAEMALRFHEKGILPRSKLRPDLWNEDDAQPMEAASDEAAA